MSCLLVDYYIASHCICAIFLILLGIRHSNKLHCLQLEAFWWLHTWKAGSVPINCVSTASRRTVWEVEVGGIGTDFYFPLFWAPYFVVTSIKFQQKHSNTVLIKSRNTNCFHIRFIENGDQKDFSVSRHILGFWKCICYNAIYIRKLCCSITTFSWNNKGINFTKVRKDEVIMYQEATEN